MQIVETTNEGLKRGYTVTIPAALIASKVEGEIARVAPQVQLPGFRPGKVPANIVRKRFGARSTRTLSVRFARLWTRLLSSRPCAPPRSPKCRWVKAMPKARTPR
jgi:trigger factor